MSPGARTRIQCIVKSTYTGDPATSALNDVLVAHPSPAAVSRFRLSLNSLDTNYNPSFQHKDHPPHPQGPPVFSYNCWSSGIWVSTATGSTAAMAAAGGYAMDKHSKNLQYMVREHLHEHEGGKDEEKVTEHGHGEMTPEQMIELRWNSQFGHIFVDGSHNVFDLALGDEVNIESHAPELQIFEVE